MKIARNVAVFGRSGEWYPPLPAPSLRELARPTGVTEGVSSDGCSMPTIYTPAIINSEIFDRLRSSKYTPSVSHSLDSSLREGAGNGLHHSTGYSLKSGVTGDFHRPYGGAVPFDQLAGIGDEILYHFPREGSRGEWGKGLVISYKM